MCKESVDSRFVPTPATPLAGFPFRNHMHWNEFIKEDVLIRDFMLPNPDVLVRKEHMLGCPCSPIKEGTSAIDSAPLGDRISKASNA